MHNIKHIDTFCYNVDKGGESDRRNSVFPAKGEKPLIPEKKRKKTVLFFKFIFIFRLKLGAH